MHKLNYRKITERCADNLTLSQIYGFYVLAMKSDFVTLESHINQTTFAKLCGVDVRTIRRWCKAYKDNHLMTIENTVIKRDDGQMVRKNVYRLNTDNYKLLGDGLLQMDVSPEIKGFLILIKCRCFNCSNVCRYSTRELSKTTKLSQSTIARYIRKCVDLGFIVRDANGISLADENIFIPHKESIYYAVLKTYPEILTDHDMQEHKIFNTDYE